MIVSLLVSYFCVVVIFAALLRYIIWTRSRFVKWIENIPGPPSLPFIGNTIELNVDHEELLTRLHGMTRLFGSVLGLARAWQGNNPYILVTRHKLVEPILNSSKHINKSKEYTYLEPWLGTGLLTSSGKKWHHRRKILTPTFHFRILEDFQSVFLEHADTLVNCLSEKAETGIPFDIFPYVTRCALDIICESAMGQKVNAQSNLQSEYVQSVYKIGRIIQSRQSKLWLQPDWLFKWTTLAQEHDKCIQVLHEFSRRVIRERRLIIQTEKDHQAKSRETDSCKRRLAFLDLLLEASQNGNLYSDEDIREEVDTFMFEGHDTTAAAISWCLFLLGSSPQIQEEAYQEVKNVLDRPGPLTTQDIQDLQFLERCIKEALRLYPSVPLIARRLNNDLILDKYTIPSGTTAIIVTYMLHRDPNVFAHPEKFNPDNFLPERCENRHPYAYIPFSAGPRNCIGRKFAMLEEKVILAKVLNRFRIEAMDRREELTLLGELILRPKNGLKIRLIPRSSTR